MQYAQPASQYTCIVVRNSSHNQVVSELVRYAHAVQERQESLRRNQSIKVSPITPAGQLSLSLPCECVFRLKHIYDIKEGEDVHCFHGNKFIAWIYDYAVPQISDSIHRAEEIHWNLCPQPNVSSARLSTQARKWKEQVIAGLEATFADSQAEALKAKDTINDELYRQIGKQKVELDWLKKLSGRPTRERKALVEPRQPEITIARQCALLGISRATYYYRSQKKDDGPLMRQIDEAYTRCPFYGARRIAKQLHRDGTLVNHKRVERLMREMSIEGVQPKRNTSKRHPQHPVYPYLLKGLHIEKVNQVWSTDITYIRLHDGWLYLVALLDWYSRYVVNWQLSDSLHSDFCVSNLQQALVTAPPEIHNSDQGRQFTAYEYVTQLQEKSIQISMDGRGRCRDNIFNERLWRTVKYEEVYLKEYRSVKEAQQSLADYFRFYNHERLHQSLGYQTPAEVYVQT